MSENTKPYVQMPENKIELDRVLTFAEFFWCNVDSMCTNGLFTTKRGIRKTTRQLFESFEKQFPADTNTQA